MTIIFSLFGGFNRSFTPMLLTTVKGLSTTKTTLLSANRCWRWMVSGVWPPWIEGAWSYRKGRRWESLTWVPPSFCCLKPLKTLASTCSQVRESKWARDSAVSNEMRQRHFDSNSQNVLCLMTGKCQTSLSICVVSLTQWMKLLFECCLFFTVGEFL